MAWNNALQKVFSFLITRNADCAGYFDQYGPKMSYYKTTLINYKLAVKILKILNDIVSVSVSLSLSIKTPLVRRFKQLLCQFHLSTGR